MLIQGKKVMYELLKKGGFGNTIRMWETIEDLCRAKEEGYSGNVSVRTSTISDTGIRPFYPNRSVYEAIDLGQRLRCLGYTVHFNETPPDHLLRINAEYMLWDGLPYMEYSTLKTAMREGLRRQRLYVESTEATLILKTVLSPASFEDITLLAEQYPEAVVEFSAYDVFVGELKGRNAVVWECRHTYL